MDELVEFVVYDHFWRAVDVLILFLVGIFVAIPVVWYRWDYVLWVPKKIVQGVIWLIQDKGLMGTAWVIWGFNSVAIFIYMASGWHPVLPKIFALLTGLNVAAIGAAAEDGALSAQQGEEFWRPGPGLALFCSIVVLLLEIPCFWFSLAMGISMGNKVQGGYGYFGALKPRIVAYVFVIVPLLLVSAVAEAVAIRHRPSRTEDRAGENTKG
ncbi:MAG: stage II sporulation protein M [Planctomycetota bacterium]